MKLSFGNMTVEMNVLSEENEVEDVDLIQTLREEYFEKVLCEPLNYERKPLPKHLKYSFLGEGETMSVVISSDLAPPQEEALLQLLRKQKQAPGWSISDLRGISPLIYTHRIFLEENAKPVR